MASGDWYGDVTERYNSGMQTQLSGAVNALSDVYKRLSGYAGDAAREIDVLGAFVVNGVHDDEDAYGYGQIRDSLTGEILAAFTNRELGTDANKAWGTYLGQMGGLIVDQLKASDIPGWMRQQLDGLGSEITIEGLNAALQTIAKVDTAFKSFAVTIDGMANLSGSVQTTLLNISGGIDALTENVGAYYQNFYSEAERVSDQVNALNEVFAKYGAVLPDTAEQYRALVEQQLAAGDSGAEFAAVLLGLNGKFKGVADAWKSELGEMSATVGDFFAGIRDDIASVMADVAGSRKDILRSAGGITPAEIEAAIGAAMIYSPTTVNVAQARGATATAASSVASAQSNADRSASEYAKRMAGVDAANRSFEAGASQKSALQSQAAALVDWINSLWDGGSNSGYSYSKRKAWSDDAAAQLDVVNSQLAAMGPNLSAMREELARQQALAAQFGTVSADDASKLAKAQAALKAAQEAEIKAKAEYAAQMGKFVKDASGSVGKLSELRGEVVGFYEAQVQAVQDMVRSASNLRSVVDTVTLGQLNSAQTARELGNRYALDYSMALATTGPTRAGYVDAMAGNLQSLTNAIKDESISSADWRIESAKILAQATNAAALLEGDTESQDFQDTTLGLLDSIDAALKDLESTTKTGEQLIADAINNGTASNLNALRAVVAALGGPPIPAFAVGTNYVPRDMLAQIHEGEAIVPKAFNPWAGGGAAAGGGSNSKQLEALVKQLISDQRIQAARQVELQIQMNKQLQRWDAMGMPEIREVSA